MKAKCCCDTGRELTPDPDCDECHGTGYVEASFPKKDDIAAVWIGRCPLCGSENGTYAQLTDKPSPLEDEYEQKWPPPCINKDCLSEHVQYVNILDIIAAWVAICPICNAEHSANYLQRHGDSLPQGVQTRTCPDDYSPMTWHRADDLE